MVPWGPHYGLDISVAQDPMLITGSVMCTPRDLPMGDFKIAWNSFNQYQQYKKYIAPKHSCSNGCCDSKGFYMICCPLKRNSIVQVTRTPTPLIIHPTSHIQYHSSVATTQPGYCQTNRHTIEQFKQTKTKGKRKKTEEDYRITEGRAVILCWLHLPGLEPLPSSPLKSSREEPGGRP